jgi:hypothetical protein
MDPELEKCRRELNELMGKVGPLFRGAHSFVMMMTLADLIAQWLLSHPHENRPHCIANLTACTRDRVAQLMAEDDEETRH